MPPRAAVRWILNGKHDGWGTFGEPTGASVLFLVLLILNLGHMDYAENIVCLIMFQYGNKFNSYWSCLLILGDINGSNYNGKQNCSLWKFKTL